MLYMERKDRSHYRVRKFQLGDPEQDTGTELRRLTPSQRIAMVFKLSGFEPHSEIRARRVPRLNYGGSHAVNGRSINSIARDLFPTNSVTRPLH